MPPLCAPVEVYDQQGPADRSLGARTRRDAGAARSGSDADAGSTSDRGSPVRHDQVVDGRHPLFLSRTLPRVSAEMGLHVLAYNLKRVMKIMGTGPLIAALHA